MDEVGQRAGPDDFSLLLSGLSKFSIFGHDNSRIQKIFSADLCGWICVLLITTACCKYYRRKWQVLVHLLILPFDLSEA